MNKLQVKRVRETIRNFPGLGQRIREAREKDSRSVTQLCKDCDISRAYWYQLESEDLRSPVTEEIVRKIEAGLNVDLGVKFDD